MPAATASAPSDEAECVTSSATTGIDERIACVDYSAGKGEPLVAYRWDGEDTLDKAKFIAG